MGGFSIWHWLIVLVIVASAMLVLSTLRFVAATREIEAPETFSATSVRREVILSGLLLGAIIVFSILLWFAARQPIGAIQ